MNLSAETGASPVDPRIQSRWGGRRTSEQQARQEAQESALTREAAAQKKAIEARRLFGERREQAAKGAVAGARERAERIADQGGDLEKRVFFQLGGEKVVGREALIAVRTHGGEIKTIYEFFSGLKDRGISFEYGKGLGVRLETKNVELDKPAGSSEEAEKVEFSTATITVPSDLGPREFPFLIREVIRALGALETHEVSRTVGGKKKGKGQGQQRTVTIIEPTEAAKVFKDEIEAEIKMEEGWNKDIVGRFGREDFRDLRKKYQALETKHSKASRAAELEIESRLKGTAGEFLGATGVDLFEPYDGRTGYNQEFLSRLLDRQHQLIHQYDDDGNLILLGRPAADVEKIRPLTLPGVLLPYWVKRAWYGKGWDVEVVRGRVIPAILNSQTERDRRLLRKIHGLDRPEGADKEFWDTTSKTAVEILKTYGVTAAEIPLALSFVVAELALAVPRKIVNKAWNWIGDKLLGDKESKLMSWAFGKGYKSPLKTGADRDKERHDEREKYKKKAMKGQE